MASDFRISGASTTSRSEADIRVNYGNTQQIIAASNDIGNSTQAQFFSTDGGTTWGQNTVTLQAGDSFNSDPAVDWTSDGTAWTVTIGINASIRCPSTSRLDNGLRGDLGDGLCDVRQSGDYYQRE